MTDTVIKGSGNSRSIKSVPTLPEEWSTARAQLINQGWPIDLGPLNKAGILTHGTDLNKANLLTDETAALLGLDSSAVPNDALMALYAFSKGMAQIRVTVKDASGNPFANIPVTGLSDVLWNTPVFTNANGVAVGYSMSGSKSFSTANILDITSVSKTVSVSAGGIYDVELVPARRNFALFESSVANLYISDAVDNVDVSVVSGGENGENAVVRSQASNFKYYRSGKGGNSGTSAKQYAIDVTKKESLFVPVVVGGSNGGTSSFLGVEAKVSSSGGGPSAATNVAGASSGVNGNPGSDYSGSYFSSFLEESPCGGSGSSGGVGGTANGSPTTSGGQKGSPNGGIGGTGSTQSATNGSAATGYGGGGGGAGAPGSLSSNNSTVFSGGAGYKGIVSARIHFKEGITV